MQYVSTRGGARPLGFSDATLAGLAPDGGLFVPETYPLLSADTFSNLRGKPFEAVAAAMLGPYAESEIAPDDLRADIDAAMGTFSHTARTPLVQIGPRDFILELFHGPTLAFKDVAMQTLAKLMDRILLERGRRATIVTATSGDTGAAAANAFAGREAIDVFILYPDGRVSDVQRRQMTTIDGDNLHTLAVDGDFDDCQRIVKQLFVDRDFNERVAMSGVNSINWARVAAQISYYVFAALALGAPDRRVAFSVPTGNFGDILAGYVATKMGLPIERLVIATNRNDILDRVTRTGDYTPGTVAPSTSPSMDIQVSSNFERLIFDLSGRDAASVAQRLTDTKNGFVLTAEEKAKMATLFSSGSANDEETAATIGAVYKDTGLIVDPHTAVGLKVARETVLDDDVALVTLSTAHPAKFPDAVVTGCGMRPAVPQRLADALRDTEKMTRVPADAAQIAQVILDRSRAVTA
ncbi:threonine synthase [Acuticoccus sp. MNP-M23]|uniref:threonine synthase n=1 Tax=Acuticoccus sp. MNP-M23 TaxID=3072793 RepID=UPI0028166C7A|nr:threonine synthase [Acuticoccus sp. MNP-M23]WMS44854.1 threonine synthase [Acuticoccus sp. MNP-M23]